MNIRLSEYKRPSELTAKLLLACGVLTYASCALATSCIELPVEEHFERSDVVFTGTVESLKDAPEAYNIKWNRPELNEKWEKPSLQAKLRVETAWKGKLDKEVLIYTGDPKKSTSGYPFEENSRYVIFASFRKTEEDSEQSELHLRTSWCAGNILLGDGENDVALADLSKNILHREHGELGSEATLAVRLEELGLKQNDSDSTKIPEEAAK